MSEIAQSYDEQSAYYDTVIERLVPNYVLFNSLIPDVIGSPKAILDLGCGTGNTAMQLMAHHPTAAITCLEPSPAMLAAAKRKLGGGVHYIQSSAEAFQASRSFDAVTSMMVMHNVQSIEARQQVYRLIHDGLEPDGVYATVDIFRGECEQSNAWFYQSWRRFLLEGFSEEEVDQKWLALHREKDRPLTLSQQVSMLSKAGFSSIDIVHKKLGFALLAARR